jgi:hypothetical protein
MHFEVEIFQLAFSLRLKQTRKTIGRNLWLPQNGGVNCPRRRNLLPKQKDEHYEARNVKLLFPGVLSVVWKQMRLTGSEPATHYPTTDALTDCEHSIIKKKIPTTAKMQHHLPYGISW